MSVYLSTQKREEQMTSNRGFPVSQLAIKLRAAALAMVMAGAATSASAAPPAESGNSSSLALGDSVVFGYIAADGYAYVNPSNFVGYPDYVGRDLRLDTANAACPGETSSSFISSTGADFGCRGFRANFPLHVSYTSTQLDFATNFLATHKQTRLVTISLGADDGFLLQESCNGDPACIQAGLPQAMATLTSNVNTILRTLRATGFRGVLMVVNYYSVDYTDPEQTGSTMLLNQTLAAVAGANGAVVADAFTEFQSAASTLFAGGKTCKAGLLNGNPMDATQMSCDDHPSQSGQQLLADTVEATYQGSRHRTGAGFTLSETNRER
jgi:lysophospholipase L1-like esterase